MKHQSNRIRPPAMFLAALLAGGLITSAQAQFNSPVGDWDFVISGNKQDGIAFFSFSDEFISGGSFEGPLLMTGKKPADSSSGRDTTATGRTNETGIRTVLFGDTYVPDGQWAFDARGRIVGFFAIPRSIPEITCTTNVFQVEGESEPVVVVNCVTNFVTDSISFVGKVKPGKRLTLLVSTPQGKLTYRGVPLTEGADISGLWTGTKKETNQTLVEFFALSPIMANTYIMDGIGAGYSYVDGICLISSQKRIGFSVVEVKDGETEGMPRTTVGPVNKSATQARTKGIKAPDLYIRFDAAPQPLLP